jgi:hypothetical protein
MAGLLIIYDQAPLGFGSAGPYGHPVTVAVLLDSCLFPRPPRRVQENRGVRRGWCQSDGMSFFDSIPPAPPPEPVRPRRLPWTRPDAVIPGSVPADMMLIRTDQVAVAIGSIRAYPTGFEFTLHTRLRHEDEAGHGADPLARHLPWRGRQVPGEVLRLGLMYADGRRTAASAARPQGDDGDPGRLVMIEGGSSGSPRRWDGEFWVYPLPPEGPVTFVASWPKHGVTETRVELGGAAIREGAARAVTLWPEEPGTGD